MFLTKFQLKVLRYIGKNPRTAHEISTKFKKIGVPNSPKWKSVFSADFITCVDVDKQDGKFENFTFHINNKGISSIENYKKDELRFWLPFSISIVALIKSFFPEILLLLERLLMLLKSK